MVVMKQSNCEYNFKVESVRFANELHVGYKKKSQEGSKFWLIQLAGWDFRLLVMKSGREAELSGRKSFSLEI